MALVLARAPENVPAGHSARRQAAARTHLDHDQCLETVILKGTAKAVRQFADAIMAERGVRHGQINLVSVELRRAPPGRQPPPTCGQRINHWFSPPPGSLSEFIGRFHGNGPWIPLTCWSIFGSVDTLGPWSFRVHAGVLPARTGTSVPAVLDCDPKSATGKSWRGHMPHSRMMHPVSAVLCARPTTGSSRP